MTLSQHFDDSKKLNPLSSASLARFFVRYELAVKRDRLGTPLPQSFLFF